MTIKKTIMATVFGAGIVLAGASGTAMAETPTGGHHECPEGKGGYDCQTDTGLSEGEQDCYVQGGFGGAAGALVGNPASAAAGAVVGCIKGAGGF